MEWWAEWWVWWAAVLSCSSTISKFLHSFSLKHVERILLTWIIAMQVLFRKNFSLTNHHPLICITNEMIWAEFCCRPFAGCHCSCKKVTKCACENILISQAFPRLLNENLSDSVSGLVCNILHRHSSAYFLISLMFSWICLDSSISKKKKPNKKTIMVSAYLSVFFSTSALTSCQYLVLINRQQFPLIQPFLPWPDV